MSDSNNRHGRARHVGLQPTGLDPWASTPAAAAPASADGRITSTAVRFNCRRNVDVFLISAYATPDTPCPDLFRASTPPRPRRPRRRKAWTAGSSPAEGIMGCFVALSHNPIPRTGQPWITSGHDDPRSHWLSRMRIKDCIKIFPGQPCAFAGTTNSSLALQSASSKPAAQGLALNCAGRLQSIRAKTCSRLEKNRCHPCWAPW